MDQYVSILKQAAAHKLPDTIGMNDANVYQRLQDLINAGLLTGKLQDTATGKTIMNPSITESGQQFLDDYIRQHHENNESSSSGKRSVWFWWCSAVLIAVSALVLSYSFVC